jgi:hypothetical protein
MSGTALSDLDFGEIFSSSISGARGASLSQGVAEGIYLESFNALCAKHNLDPKTVVVGQLTKEQKGDLLRAVTVIALKRGHSRKNVFAILGRCGLRTDAIKMKVWNSAVKEQTHIAFKSAFNADPAAIDTKSTITWLLTGNHVEFIHTSPKTQKKVNLLREIGYKPYLELANRISKFRAEKLPEDATPEQIAEREAEYDAIVKERESLFTGVTEKVDYVNNEVKGLFSSKDRASRARDEFETDDELLAAMTVGGIVEGEMDLADTDDEDIIAQ